MEHTDVAEMGAYGDVAAAASNQFSFKTREEPSSKLGNQQHRIMRDAILSN